MTQTDFDTAKCGDGVGAEDHRHDEHRLPAVPRQRPGFLANADSTRMFQILTQAPNPAGGWFLEIYFTVDMTTDPANPKIIINKDYITRASIGTRAAREVQRRRPIATVATPSAYDRLTTFYNTTMTKFTAAGAAGCGPSKLGTPLP